MKNQNKILIITGEQNINLLSYDISDDEGLVFTFEKMLPGFNDEITDVKFFKYPELSDSCIYSTNSS